MRKYNKLVILGTGNVAHALTQVLRDSGRTILQVWGRNEEAAKKLGNMLHVSFTSEMDELDPNADAYIICVKDDAIASVAAQFPFANKPLIHTAGTISVDVLSASSRFPAVWWIMQSIQKNTALYGAPSILDFKEKEMAEPLHDLAGVLRGEVVELNVDQRKKLHVTAVMLANFSQYLGGRVIEFAEKNQLPTHLLYPIMRNVLHQVMEGQGLEHLTGPARRNDKHVMQQQMDLLGNETDLKILYKVFSEQIVASFEQNK
ncbi:MAG: DUF2520 domain-containing protein [Hydrotalea sp.]|nr:DUF2520 domain-containing protein [Hydrotalea sp.]